MTWFNEAVKYGMSGASVTELLVAVVGPGVIYLRLSNSPAKSEATSQHDWNIVYWDVKPRLHGVASQENDAHDVDFVLIHVKQILIQRQNAKSTLTVLTVVCPVGGALHHIK